MPPTSAIKISEAHLFFRTISARARLLSDSCCFFIVLIMASQVCWRVMDMFKTDLSSSDIPANQKKKKKKLQVMEWPKLGLSRIALSCA